MKPKYALPEIERRWLVPEAKALPLLATPPIRITDKYVHGTRLRLRRMDMPEGDTVFKFCKKYGDRQGPVEPITNLYLSASEHACLDQLPGVVVRKDRHRQERGAVDVYRLPQETVYVFEIEFAALEDAGGYAPPEFAGREITEDAAFSGLALARRGNE